MNKTGDIIIYTIGIKYLIKEIMNSLCQETWKFRIIGQTEKTQPSRRKNRNVNSPVWIISTE